MAARGRAYRAKNPEKVNAYYRRVKDTPEFKAKRLVRELWRAYKITPEEREAMYAAQGYECAVCPATEVEVDHCHAIGKVRGLLCSQCNMALGLLQDHGARIRKLAAYIDLATYG